MKVIIAVLLYTLASVQADYDWSKITPRHVPFAGEESIRSHVPAPRITGGEEAAPNSIPYQAGLLLPVNGGTAFCGGSLISERTVLTAAHCVDSLVGPVEVVLGAHRIQTVESTQVRINSSRVIVHPGWNPLLLENDLALVILPENVALNANIRTINLPRAAGNSYVGANAVVSGWGRDSDSSQQISPVLRQVTIPVISNFICTIRYLGMIQESHICADGADGKSTCNGDSGGPLVVIGEHGLEQADYDWSEIRPHQIPFAGEEIIRSHIPAQRITGGEEAVPHSIPYQVGLLLPVKEKTALCGGSLISERTVLTAAHCVKGLTGPIEVVLGAHRIQKVESTQVRVNTSRIIIHPGWNPDLFKNDVALVILPEKVKLNANIRTINLPKAAGNSYYGASATISGWGRDSDSSDFDHVSPVLKKVTIPVISNLICNIFYVGMIQGSHICGDGDGGKSACSGDSGGPMVVLGKQGPEQVGIACFGIPALGCEVGWPTAYTRVTSFLDWINENKV